MNSTRFKLNAVVSASALLAACASQPVATRPGEIKVQYSQTYPDGSRLKEIPAEVAIVRREATVNNVAGQAALNVVLLALGGGIGVQGFSKDDLKGARIEDAASRAKLRNPVTNEFVSGLQTRVSAAMQQRAELREKAYRQPILVAGGDARLVYEALAGADEERFRLKLDLTVYKRREDAGPLTFNPYVVVGCRDASNEPLPQSQWAHNDYQLIKTQLDAMLASCETKVLAELPNLLKD